MNTRGILCDDERKGAVDVDLLLLCAPTLKAPLKYKLENMPKQAEART